MYIYIYTCIYKGSWKGTSQTYSGDFGDIGGWKERETGLCVVVKMDFVLFLFPLTLEKIHIYSCIYTSVCIHIYDLCHLKRYKHRNKKSETDAVIM